MEIDESTNMNIEVRRYSLKYKPPTLIIEYHDLCTNKTFHRRIRFKGIDLRLTRASTPEKIADKIIKKNADILSYNTISIDQLVDMIKLLLFSDDDEESFETEDPPQGIASALPASSSTVPPQLITSGIEEPSDQNIFNQITSPKIDMHVQTIEHKEDIFGDLNKVSEEENKRAKELMSIEFERNRLQAADKEFVYDKQIEIGTPQEDNEWDDDDD